MDKAVSMDQLNQKLVDLAAQAKVIENTADAEKRSLSDDDINRITQITNAFSSVEQEIESRKSTAAMEARLAVPQPRMTKPADVEQKPPALSTAQGGLQ